MVAAFLFLAAVRAQGVTQLCAVVLIRLAQRLSSADYRREPLEAFGVLSDEAFDLLVSFSAHTIQ